MKLKKNTINNLITYAIVVAAFAICQSMITSGSMTRALKGQGTGCGAAAAG